MKISQLFGQTLRDSPTNAEVESHKLLLRAGFIRPIGAGIFAYLHLAKRSFQKIESILRDEMNKIGGQEILMPFVHPAEIWEATGRWYQIGSEMGRFKDKNNHDMALAMTHEEVIADLVRREVHSYKQLPLLLYHIQTKWRDDPRPRAGLIRAREFTMKDSYSLDVDLDGLERQYRAHYQAYFNIFHRCGLKVIAIKSDSGMMGGKLAHEFMYLTSIGEDAILICDACGYAANRQVARFHKLPIEPEEMKLLEKIHTPSTRSIEELANFLGVAKSKTAKAVFYMASLGEKDEQTEKFIFAVLRGDTELNETKLSSAIGARDLRPATEDEIKAIGAVPGFASPINLLPVQHGKEKRPDVVIVVDEAIASSPNLVAGANSIDHHLLNTNYIRDYRADIITDIAAAWEGAPCPECFSPLRISRGIEVGNIFQLGTRYSDAIGCTFLDRDGQQKPIIMGSYGIGVGRLLACIAEEYHDKDGLVWPATVSPYQVHLVLLRSINLKQVNEVADRFYIKLLEAEIEVLYDDRNESPGIKFNDADLIGIPIRITISQRVLDKGSVEMKLRKNTEKIMLPLDTAVEKIKSVVEMLETDITNEIYLIEYNG
jgi:prolyl-tRNA synthetase